MQWGHRAGGCSAAAANAEAGPSARPPPPVQLQLTRGQVRPGPYDRGQDRQPEPMVSHWSPLLGNNPAAQSFAEKGIAELTASNQVAVGTWSSGPFRQDRLSEHFHGGPYHIALAQACLPPNGWAPGASDWLSTLAQYHAPASPEHRHVFILRVLAWGPRVGMVDRVGTMGGLGRLHKPAISTVCMARVGHSTYL